MIFNQTFNEKLYLSQTEMDAQIQHSMFLGNTSQLFNDVDHKQSCIANEEDTNLTYPIELITETISKKIVNDNNVRQLKQHSDYVKTFFQENFVPNTKIQRLHKEIIDYFVSNGCVFTNEFSLEKITAKNQPLEYVCNCETIKHKAFKEILSRNCRECQNEKLKQAPKKSTVITPLNPSEIWNPVDGGFISSLGRCCNVFGKLLIADERGRYYLAGRSQYASILLAVGFQIKDYELLGGQHCQYVVRVKTQNLIPTLEDIYVGTRSEVGSENGKKSHQSERFKEKCSMDLVEHMEKYDYIKDLPELPNHILFEDGNIYSRDCNRFLTFSESTEKGKTYYTACLIDSAVKVNRIICYAFHPMEGKTCLKDYDELKANHIDGNTLNNHKDNLEWTTHGKNMQHAYATGLNKKVREVEQYIKNEDGTRGDKLESFKSLAEASRKTGVREHTIREFARNKSKNGEFFWKYANEEQNEEFSRRFSSRR
jgi:hypothetical protein